MSAEIPAGRAIIDLLDGRKGFDYWWHDIDPETRAEIVARLDELVQQRVRDMIEAIS